MTKKLLDSSFSRVTRIMNQRCSSGLVAGIFKVERITLTAQNIQNASPCFLGKAVAASDGIRQNREIVTACASVLGRKSVFDSEARPCRVDVNDGARLVDHGDLLFE